MRRTLTVAAIILTGLMSYGLYNMKYEVRRLEAELADLRQQITVDQKGLQVLRAEWAYLNRPARLEKLATRHLDLAPIAAIQVGSIIDLPLMNAKPGSGPKTIQKSARHAHLVSGKARVAQ
jgi:cell division protein FtsL